MNAIYSNHLISRQQLWRRFHHSDMVSQHFKLILKELGAFMKTDLKHTWLAALISFTLVACSSKQNHEGETTLPSSPILLEPPVAVAPTVPIENLLPSDSNGNPQDPDLEEPTIVPVTGILIDDQNLDQPVFIPVENPTLPISTTIPSQPEATPGSSTPIVDIVEESQEEIITPSDPPPASENEETLELVLIGFCKGKNTVQLTLSDSRKNNSETVRVHCRQDSFAVKMLLKKKDFPFVKLEPLGQ